MEILFRGKRKDNGEWIEGYFVMVDPVDIPDKIRKLKAVIFPAKAKCNWFNKYFYNAVEVIPETIGRFTGLIDKNGKKVFEGDILAFRLEDEEQTIDGVIKYGQFNCSCCDGVYGWYIEGGDIRYIHVDYGYDDHRVYVVGNIHDNPELLEV